MESSFVNFHNEYHGLAELFVLSRKEILLKAILGTQSFKAQIVSNLDFLLWFMFSTLGRLEQLKNFQGFTHVILVQPKAILNWFCKYLGIGNQYIDSLYCANWVDLLMIVQYGAWLLNLEAR